MTVTVELKPEIKARITAQAAARGIPVEEYIQSLLESIAGAAEKLPQLTTPQERARMWEEWSLSHDPKTPVILDDNREAIYDDDGR